MAPTMKKATSLSSNLDDTIDQVAGRKIGKKAKRSHQDTDDIQFLEETIAEVSKKNPITRSQQFKESVSSAMKSRKKKKVDDFIDDESLYELESSDESYESDDTSDELTESDDLDEPSSSRSIKKKKTTASTPARYGKKKYGVVESKNGKNRKKNRKWKYDAKNYHEKHELVELAAPKKLKKGSSKCIHIGRLIGVKAKTFDEADAPYINISAYEKGTGMTQRTPGRGISIHFDCWANLKTAIETIISEYASSEDSGKE